jgi:hypothetical protein
LNVLRPEEILSALTIHQHLHPHQPLGSAVAQVARSAGVCPRAVEVALAWLGLDAEMRFGRLRRTELTQLSRSIHRFWRDAVSQAQSAGSGRF